MKKVRIVAGALVAVAMLSGCGDSYIPFENKNPTYNQVMFDNAKKLLEEKFGKEYNIYHYESALNNNKFSNEIKNEVQAMVAYFAKKQDRNNIGALLVNKKNNKKAFIQRVYCSSNGECEIK